MRVGRMRPFGENKIDGSQYVPKAERLERRAARMRAANRKNILCREAAIRTWEARRDAANHRQ